MVIFNSYVSLPEGNYGIPKLLSRHVTPHFYHSMIFLGYHLAI